MARSPPPQTPRVQWAPAASTLGATRIRPPHAHRHGGRLNDLLPPPRAASADRVHPQPTTLQTYGPLPDESGDRRSAGRSTVCAVLLVRRWRNFGDRLGDRTSKVDVFTHRVVGAPGAAGTRHPGRTGGGTDPAAPPGPRGGASAACFSNLPSRTARPHRGALIDSAIRYDNVYSGVATRRPCGRC